MAGCCDCSKCVESGMTKLFKLPFRIVLWLPRLFLRAFKKKCPQCGHLLEFHARRLDGSFKD